MKKLFPLLALLPFLALATIPSGPVPVTIYWSYPATNQVDSFYVYYTTNVILPMPWTPLTNSPGTQLNATVSLTPGQYYFYVTASNFWGESGTSNVTNTPTILSNNPTGTGFHK